MRRQSVMNTICLGPHLVRRRSGMAPPVPGRFNQRPMHGLIARLLRNAFDCNPFDAEFILSIRDASAGHGIHRSWVSRVMEDRSLLRHRPVSASCARPLAERRFYGP